MGRIAYGIRADHGPFRSWLPYPPWAVSIMAPVSTVGRSSHGIRHIHGPAETLAPGQSLEAVMTMAYVCRVGRADLGFTSDKWAVPLMAYRALCGPPT